MIKENNTPKEDALVRETMNLLREKRLSILFQFRPGRSARWLENATRQLMILDDLQNYLATTIEDEDERIENPRPVGFTSDWKSVDCIAKEYPEDVQGDEDEVASAHRRDLKRFLKSLRVPRSLKIFS